MLTDEYGYKILKQLELNPEINQRELAKELLGINLGANPCIQALMEKGRVTARNFKNSQNKEAYIYCLTPKGIEAKAIGTLKFLKHKVAEYEALKIEIERLGREVKSINLASRNSDVLTKATLGVSLTSMRNPHRSLCSHHSQ